MDQSKGHKEHPKPTIAIARPTNPKGHKEHPKPTIAIARLTNPKGQKVWKNGKINQKTIL